jgi:hypothetical protein
MDTDDSKIVCDFEHPLHLLPTTLMRDRSSARENWGFPAFGARLCEPLQRLNVEALQLI